MASVLNDRLAAWRERRPVVEAVVR